MLSEESFIDMCLEDPLENPLTVPERDIFTIDNRADEYARLMDASEEVMIFDEENDNETKLNIDRYLQRTNDQWPLALDSWSSERVTKV